LNVNLLLDWKSSRPWNVETWWYCNWNNFGTLQSRFWYFDRSISGEVLNNGFSLFLFVLNLWWFALEILLGILLLHKRPHDGRSQKTRSDEGLRFCGGNFPWLTMCLGLSHTDIPSRELTYPLLKALLKIIFLFRLWDVLVIHRQVCACSTFIQNGERFAELAASLGLVFLKHWDGNHFFGRLRGCLCNRIYFCKGNDFSVDGGFIQLRMDTCHIEDGLRQLREDIFLLRKDLIPKGGVRGI